MVGGGGWSEEMEALLQGLSRQQRAAVPRLAASILQGRGVARLLQGPEKVCTEATYYRKAKPGRNGPGWFHQEGFRKALDLATEELGGRQVREYVEQSVQRMAAQLPYTDEFAETYLRASVQAAKRLGIRAKVGEKARGQVAADRVLAQVGARLYGEIKSRVSELTARKDEVADARRWEDLLEGLRAKEEGDGPGSAGVLEAVAAG